MAKQKRPNTGLSPGSLVFTGRKFLEKANITLVRYNEEESLEEHVVSPIGPPADPATVSWFDIRGLHDTDLVRHIGERFGIHQLVLEDILDPQQRPKFEEYDNGIFLIARALTFHSETSELETEQISIFAGKNFILSFQEKEDDQFKPVRNRILSPQARIRRRKADYLAYALADTLVDEYYNILDQIEDRLNVLESNILENSGKRQKAEIYQLKIDCLNMRKSVAPLRDAISQWSRCDSALIADETTLFLRDLYDHTVQILDSIDTFRDIINGLYDLYLSEISYRMNNIMKVLTIISTLFIPLTFLAGVYGMNFKNLPELNWPNGYFLFWGVCVIITIGMIIFFRRRKWM